MSSLRPEDFADDVEIRIRCGDREAWLSERLLRRLALIGAAYELHLLPLLAGDISLNPVQADGLLGELDFVGALVEDAALMSALSTLAPLVRGCRASADSISFEWP
jgi:hypothetical protein